MAIPAWRLLVLRRVAGKRPPQRFGKERWAGSGASEVQVPRRRTA